MEIDYHHRMPSKQDNFYRSIGLTGRPTPTGKERDFTIDQMFFSTTDGRGVIEFGNGVFIKISGYEKETMFGAPHNIIRHPDMPKTVFKVLWDTIKAGRPIVAYVKNMSKTGDHYWVVASVFPVKNGYLSIRIKPSSAIFPIAQKLYAAMLTEEKAHGMDAALDLLVKSLGELGFKDYESFMTHMLFTELQSRDVNIQKLPAKTPIVDNQTAHDKKFSEKIENVAHTTAEVFNSIFKIVDGFKGSSQFFQKNVNDLLEEFADLRLISLNLRVLSANFGEKGLAMSKIAAQFQEQANEVETYLNLFSKIIETTVEQMRKCVMNVAFMKLQTDMVDFFVRESIGQMMTGDVSEIEAFEGLDLNAEIFSSLCIVSGERARTQLIDLNKNLQGINQAGREIKKHVNGLDVIEKMGAIEAGRISEIQETIRGRMQVLEKFNGHLRNAVKDIAATERVLAENVDSILRKINDAVGGLETIFTLAATTKKENELNGL